VSSFSGEHYKADIDASIAVTKMAEGNFAEAEPLFKSAIQLLNDNAPQHSDLASALEAYASLLRKMNRTKEAEPMERRAVQIRTNVTSDRMHPRS
jgi:tetratricopeptide (TPR) repeat protein